MALIDTLSPKRHPQTVGTACHIEAAQSAALTSPRQRCRLLPGMLMPKCVLAVNSQASKKVVSMSAKIPARFTNADAARKHLEALL